MIGFEPRHRQQLYAKQVRLLIATGKLRNDFRCLRYLNIVQTHGAAGRTADKGKPTRAIFLHDFCVVRI